MCLSSLQAAAVSAHSIPPVQPTPSADAVKAAVSGWGERQLEELEAEDRLAFACEKAPTTDPVIEKVRSGWDALLRGGRVGTCGSPEPGRRCPPPTPRLRGTCGLAWFRRAALRQLSRTAAVSHRCSLTTAQWLLRVQIRAAFLKVEAEYKQVTGEWGSAACCCRRTPLLLSLHTSAAGEAALLWLPMRQSRLAAPSSQRVALQRVCALAEVQKPWPLGVPYFSAPFGAFTHAPFVSCPADVEKVEVQKLGGLHVVGTERHESRRIDNQLRGRSGRQGDQGSTRYFLSLEVGGSWLHLFCCAAVVFWWGWRVSSRATRVPPATSCRWRWAVAASSCCVLRLLLVINGCGGQLRLKLLQHPSRDLLEAFLKPNCTHLAE